MLKVADETKLCSKCKAVKPLAEFHKNANSPDGRSYWCKVCACASAREYRRNPPPRRRIGWRAKDGLKRCCVCKQVKLVSEFSKRKTPDGLQYCCKSCNSARGVQHHLRRAYGITEDVWQRMFDAQGGVCVICRRPEDARFHGKLKRLSVDHNHKTGALRGLLCSACNHGLGKFRDDTRLLRRAIDYLEGRYAPDRKTDWRVAPDADADRLPARDAGFRLHADVCQNIPEA